MRDPAAFLRALFDAAVAAADPARVLAAHLPEPPRRGRCVVVGAGKAAASMARAVERAWPQVAMSGAVAVPHGQADCGCSRIRVLHASHPKPDGRSERAGRHMLSLVEGLGREDLVLFLAGIARSIRTHALPLPSPCVLLSGGECTVTIGGGEEPGRGGRNTEAALGFVLAAPPDCWALMADTDGIDGDSGAAGAIVRPDTLRRAASLNLDPASFLHRHDSAGLFGALGDLVSTGPTHTNVNDFRTVLIA